MTCWRRLRDWAKAGVWPKLHQVLLAELNEADKIDWTRALIDSSFVRARGGGEKTGPSPVDRGKKGSKHQVVTDARGVPLVAETTAANVPDVNPMIPLVDAIPPVRGKPGHPRRRPDRLFGDRGYDSDPHRRELRRRGIRPRIARRRTAHGSGLGKSRWYVERTLSWLHDFGRLRVRKDKSAAIHQAFLTLGCAMICLRLLC
jgi:transposase